jgi:predicted nuclease with TOPRIM domain
MLEWVKNHPYETVFCVVIASATICGIYYLGVEYGRSLPNTENIELKAKVTQLNSELRTTKELIVDKEVELSQLNDKYIKVIEQFTAFDKSVKEFTYDTLITSLKKFKVLTSPDISGDQYVAAIKDIHDVLTIGAIKLLPLVEQVALIVI